jgi:hypothetical protein
MVRLDRLYERPPRRARRPVSAVLLLALAATVQAAPPSRFAVDAPELAALGPNAVGVRTLSFTQHDQADVLAFDAKTGRVPLHDRTLRVEVWYPAHPATGARPAIYSGTLPSMPPAPPARFSIEGLAVRDAPAVEGRHPLLIVSHGYSNDPVALSWLTENMASKTRRSPMPPSAPNRFCAARSTSRSSRGRCPRIPRSAGSSIVNGWHCSVTRWAGTEC